MTHANGMARGLEMREMRLGMDTKAEGKGSQSLSEPGVQVKEVEPGRCQHDWRGIDTGVMCYKCGQFHGEVLISISKVAEWAIGGPVKSYRQAPEQVGADEEDSRK